MIDILGYIIFGIIVLFIIFFVRIIKEYERGIKFTLGIFTGIMKPGINIVIPIIQTYTVVDIRTKVVDVPEQNAITKDNVSVNINAVLYYRISEPKMAVLEIMDYHRAVSQLSQITMKNITGEVSLDDLLSKRDMVSTKIKEIVDKLTDPWGIKIEGVDLKHIELPPEMKRVLAAEAEAERERRAVVIHAQGEVAAAQNIATAATTLSKTPGSLHLRTLNSINDLARDKSHTKIFAIPAEILRMVRHFSK
jgi:regulator of protease activity HflC (stomatin/prohibitin superfamily)